MKLTDIELINGNHFIAMHYYGLILNRTYLVLITNNHLIGIVANGLVSIKGGGDYLSRQITTHLAIDGDLNNPFSYLNEKYLEKANDLHLLSDDLTKSNRSNFRYEYKEIISADYDPRKKWGMGYYPHDGKVNIKVIDRMYEFIVLGNQSGLAISDLINNAKKNANKLIQRDF